ncbi:MAG: acyl-CoA dehydrogenase family protein [Alphaproteobacteria bacterium]|jgi:isovaleryl-CoA dehydrogenase|nr:acyl-CoA dehydrogenase family protein [Alphaproteobacteria bacterium]
MNQSSDLGNLSPNAFALSDEQMVLRDEARRYFMAQFFPLQPRMDDESWWPEEAFPTLGGMGYLGLTIPEEYGGSGLDYLTAGLISEVMAEANPAIAWSATGHSNLCLDNIFRNGNEAQRRKYVPKMCTGEYVGALAMTEPGAGTDAIGSMRSRARLDGDHYILNGGKIFISNGPIADVMLVYAKTDPDAGNQGVSAFIVEKDFPGFSVAQKLDKMGYRGSPLGELVFEDCKVPAENLLGQENRGVAVMMSGLDMERAYVTTISLGTAQRALDISIEYAKTREQFGKPIASFQLIQAKLAEMYIRLEAARTLAYRGLAACAAMDTREAGRGDIHKLAAASVHFAAEAATTIMDHAVQIHGGGGYMRDTEVNRLYRTAKIMEIAAGTQEIRKLIIAGELLKD